MGVARITYENLFSLLASLGFEESPQREAPLIGPRIFVHRPTETVLLFRSVADETVTPADILSTEVHLQAKGIANEPLDSLLGAMPANK